MHRIRQVAEAQGLDIAKLSRRADVSYLTAWRIWHDPTRTVRPAVLAKIAQALGVPAGELIEGG